MDLFTLLLVASLAELFWDYKSPLLLLLRRLFCSSFWWSLPPCAFFFVCLLVIVWRRRLLVLIHRDAVAERDIFKRTLTDPQPSLCSLILRLLLLLRLLLYRLWPPLGIWPLIGRPQITHTRRLAHFYDICAAALLSHCSTSRADGIGRWMVDGMGMGR